MSLTCGIYQLYLFWGKRQETRDKRQTGCSTKCNPLELPVHLGNEINRSINSFRNSVNRNRTINYYSKQTSAFHFTKGHFFFVFFKVCTFKVQSLEFIVEECAVWRMQTKTWSCRTVKKAVRNLLFFFLHLITWIKYYNKNVARYSKITYLGRNLNWSFNSRINADLNE